MMCHRVCPRRRIKKVTGKPSENGFSADISYEVASSSPKRDLTLRALAPQDTSAAHFTAYQAANLTVSLLDHKAGQDEQKGK